MNNMNANDGSGHCTMPLFQKYKCHKTVEAFKISRVQSVEESENGEINIYGFNPVYVECALTVDFPFCEKHKPEVGGYIVKYADGYVSYSPAKPFEDGYTLIVEDSAAQVCSFGDAIIWLKQGYKVARTGWNGKGMFLWLKPATMIKSEWCKDPMLKELADANGGEIEGLGTICMKTADNKILTGWLAQQIDILSNDWVVV